MTKRTSSTDAIASPSPTGLREELRQPLTAACNYIGAARLLLASSDDGARKAAGRNLDKAELQILRAGDMIRLFQGTGLRQSAKN
jgi:phosphoglycerate-specific signal transduction histidine kinase